MYLDKVKRLLYDKRLIQPKELIPCTLEEVKTLEQQINLSLPAVYVEFLLWMGKSSGNLWRGSDCFYSHLPHIQGWAADLLADDDFPQPLPEDAFVFFMHQGYQFSFFRTSEGNDPPVYYYLEAQKEMSFIVSYPSYSQYLMSVLKRYAAFLEGRQS